MDLPGTTSADRDLLEQASKWEGLPGLSDCSPEQIQEVTRRHGLEFATAVLYDRVLRQAGNRKLFLRVHNHNSVTRAQPLLVGIIPGAFHQEHKNTGADGDRISALVETMNCPVERVPVESFGSLSSNASIIAGWLAGHKNQPVILISLSKGSADIKVTLRRPDATELFGNVVTWISLSGLPQGTPLVTWLRRQPLRRLGVRVLLALRRQRYSVVEELRPESDGPLAVWPQLPPQLRVIHVVGFPLRRHLAHPWAARGYERIAPLGPNDGGGFLLADASRLPGMVFPVWGADHYLQPQWDVLPALRELIRRR